MQVKTVCYTSINLPIKNSRLCYPLYAVLCTIVFLCFSCGQNDSRKTNAKIKLALDEQELAEQIVAAERVLKSVHGDSVDVYSHIEIEGGNVVKFDLGSPKVDTMPEGLGRLTNLKTLIISNTNIRHVPHDIFELTQIESLVIDFNNIVTLPEELGNLRKIKYLDLYNNDLNKLPQSIGNLGSLHVLSAGVNDLQDLPSSFCNLLALEELDLSNNEIRALPECIGNLTALEHFGAYDNRLSTLPTSVKVLIWIHWTEKAITDRLCIGK